MLYSYISCTSNYHRLTATEQLIKCAPYTQKLGLIVTFLCRDHIFNTWAQKKNRICQCLCFKA